MMMVMMAMVSVAMISPRLDARERKQRGDSQASSQQ
jgi:hypothetical protein